MLRALLVVLALALTVVWGCATPTLPLPPPIAAASAPNADGFVTVEGTAKSSATLFLYNEDTEAGVIGVADDEGVFALVIAARRGHALVLWQESGGVTGTVRTLVVPDQTGDSDAGGP